MGNLKLLRIIELLHPSMVELEQANKRSNKIEFNG